MKLSDPSAARNQSGLSEFGSRIFGKVDWSSPEFRREVWRYCAALALAVLLIAFLVFTRWLESRRTQPDITLRTLQGTSVIDMPAPPPPPPPSEPPPPPKTPPLPKLDIQIDSPAPALKASLDPDMPKQMTLVDFLPSRNQPRERMSFYLRDLDTQPRLLNRPRVRFPSNMRRRGIYKGRVTLEIEISPSGVPTVLRVIDASHPEFISMARSFATRARFTAPKKDGRAVAAKFQWPLVLQ